VAQKTNSVIFRYFPLLVTFFLLFPLFQAAQGNPTESKFSAQSFRGLVCSIDYASPHLDFVIMTQERPGQISLLDDVSAQPFEFIWVHRDLRTTPPKILREIKDILLKGFENGGIDVLVRGKFCPDMELTIGKADGYLVLSSIKIYVPNGESVERKSYVFEGVEGGVYGVILSCPYVSIF